MHSAVSSKDKKPKPYRQQRKDLGLEKISYRSGYPCLSFYFSLAEQAHKVGSLEEAKELYAKILQISNTLYINAEAYVRQRIELEERLKGYNRQALSLYKSGRHLEAKALWQKMIKESEPATINFYVN